MKRKVNTYRIARILVLSLLALFMATRADAQQILDRAALDSLMTRVTAYDTPWDSVNLSGKLRSSMLPVSPTIKISMVRGQSISISLRVFLLGEVGRLEISNNSITGVNKMKNVYCHEEIPDILSDLPLGISEIQALLLGRPFLLNRGELQAQMAPDVTGYRGDSGAFVIVPKEQPQYLDMNYGFEFYDNARLSQCAVGTHSDSTMANADYTYKDNGDYRVDLRVILNYKEIQARLDLDEPKWDEPPMTPFSPTSKFKRVTIKEFMKSF